MMKRQSSPWIQLPVALIVLALLIASTIMEHRGWAPVPIVYAEPYVPQTETTVLERLPLSGDSQVRELRQLRKQFSKNPDDLTLALKLARRYVEVGGAEADPRYDGYAQAALRPWWK